MRKSRKIIGGWLAGMLLLAVAGCSGDGGEDLSAVTSIPEDPSTTTTSTTEPRTVAVDVIPRDESLITEAYVENVLNALFEVSLEAALIAREEGVVGEAAVELIEATNGQEEAVRVLNSFAEGAREGFPEYVSDPDPMTVDVLEVVEASSDCVTAEVFLDGSGLTGATVARDPDRRDFAELRPASAEQRAKNPTVWVISQIRVTLDGSSVANELCEHGA